MKKHIYLLLFFLISVSVFSQHIKWAYVDTTSGKHKYTAPIGFNFSNKDSINVIWSYSVPMSLNGQQFPNPYENGNYFNNNLGLLVTYDTAMNITSMNKVDNNGNPAVLIYGYNDIDSNNNLYIHYNFWDTLFWDKNYYVNKLMYLGTKNYDDFVAKIVPTGEVEWCNHEKNIYDDLIGSKMKSAKDGTTFHGLNPLARETINLKGKDLVADNLGSEMNIVLSNKGDFIKNISIPLTNGISKRAISFQDYKIYKEEIYMMALIATPFKFVLGTDSFDFPSTSNGYAVVFFIYDLKTLNYKRCIKGFYTKGLGMDIPKFEIDIYGNVYLAIPAGENLYRDSIVILINSYDFYLTKFNNNGGLLWTKIIGGKKSESIICQITSDNYGNLFFSARTKSVTIQMDDILLVNKDTLLGDILCTMIDGLTSKSKYSFWLGSKNQDLMYNKTAFNQYGDLFFIFPNQDTLPVLKYVSDTSFVLKGNKNVLCVLRNSQLLVVPKQLKAKALSSYSIELNWYDSTTGEQQFYIERSPDGLNNWVRIDSVPANTTQYIDTGLQVSTLYFYRIRSAVPWFASTPSNTDSATTKPFGLSVVTLSPKVNIYPNPFSHEFTLDAGAAVVKSIQVFSVEGKLVSEPTCNHCSGKQNINLKHLASGVYYIKVCFANNVETTLEIVKE